MNQYVILVTGQLRRSCPAFPGRVFLSITCLFFLGLPSRVCSQTEATQAASFAQKPRVDQPDSIQFFSTYFRKKDDLGNWMLLHKNIGRAFIYEKEEPTAGVKSFQTALQIWRNPVTVPEWQGLASLHLNLGYFYHVKKGDFVKVREHYERCRVIYQDTLQQADLYLAERVLTPLGNVHARFRDYEKALYYLQQAKNICIQKEAWEQAAIATNGIGWMYVTKNQYQQSIPYFQEGLRLPNLSPPTQVMLMLNLGSAFLHDNQSEKALQWTLDAQRLLELRPGEFTTAQSLELWADLHDNLARIYQNQQQWSEAASHFHRFIALIIEKSGTPNRREVAQGYLELCNLFMDRNRPDSSLHYAQTALRCLLPTVLPADDFANPTASQLYAEHTLYLVFERKIKALQALSKRNPGDANLLSKCLETCDLLFTTDEILRRGYAFEESKLYRQDASRPYFEIALSAAYRLQALTHDPAWTERAWQYAELARERLLIESMHERDREVAARVPEARRQLASLRETRTKLQTQIFEKNLRSEATDSLDILLFETHLAWQGLLTSAGKPKSEVIGQLPRTDLVALQQLLKADGAMLEFFSGDSAGYVFVLTNRELRFIQCSRWSDLSIQVQQLRKSLTDEGLRDVEDDLPLFLQSAPLLYDALLAEPLALLPPSIRQLVIVPDGLLHEVPFELLGKNRGSANFKTFPYLLRRYAVGYASSGNMFLKQSAAAHHPDAMTLQPFIGFAPQYNDSDTLVRIVSRTRALQVRGGSYPDLPESRKEVREIAKLLTGKAYTGPEASERQFKLQAAHCRILHLAMHTWIESENPMFSKLFFTQNPLDTLEDNDLNALELYDTPLSAQLAVLSACETGLGKIRQGEGVMSLARAFAYAGVPATLMSLWQVEDGATHELMVDFYRHLKTGLRKDEALQQTKLNYLKNCEPLRANPYYWGGFIASGNMEPLFGH